MRAGVACGRTERGAALVEFALLSLVVYLLVAGGIELGRMIFVSQTLQDAARLAARELSVTPLPADATFEDLIRSDCTTSPMFQAECNLVQSTIWNPNLLVLDVTACPPNSDLNAFVTSLPLVNRALWPVFISETLNPGQPGERRLLRYPGALLMTNKPAAAPACPTAAPDLTVAIPQVVGRNANAVSSGVETIKWIPVMSEVRGSNPADPNCAAYGPFSFQSAPPTTLACPTDTPANARGIAAVAINYPFQSAALSGYRHGQFDEQGNPCDSGGYDANGAPCANLDGPNGSDAGVIGADDADVTVQGGAPSNTNGPVGGQTSNPTYSGPYGLGGQVAYAGTKGAIGTVRPYRNLLLGQAMFRREVIE